MLNVAILCTHRIVDIFRAKFKNNKFYKFIFIFEDLIENKCEDEYKFEKIKDKNYHFLEEYSIDLVIVYYWNYLIPKSVVTKYSIFNIHPSFLPKYRGRYPVLFQLLQNESYVGITMHKMDENFDTGSIYQQEKFEIDENYNLIDIKLCKIAIKFIEKLLKDFINGEIILQEQNNQNATYFYTKDIDKYLISNDTKLDEFKRLQKIFEQYPPFRIVINGNIYDIISYSMQPTIGSHFFNLNDSIIYLTLKSITYINK